MADNKEFIATSIEELSRAFMANYIRALEEARIDVTDVAEAGQEAVAKALASAARQNVEVIEFFCSALGSMGGAEWVEKLQALKMSAMDLANKLSDERTTAFDKIAEFINSGRGGLETVVGGIEDLDGKNGQ